MPSNDVNIQSSELKDQSVTDNRSFHTAKEFSNSVVEDQPSIILESGPVSGNAEVPFLALVSEIKPVGGASTNLDVASQAENRPYSQVISPKTADIFMSSSTSYSEIKPFSDDQKDPPVLKHLVNSELWEKNPDDSIGDNIRGAESSGLLIPKVATTEGSGQGDVTKSDPKLEEKKAKIQDMLQYGKIESSRIFRHGSFGLATVAFGAYFYFSANTTLLSKIGIIWGTTLCLCGAFFWATQKVPSDQDRNQIDKIALQIKTERDLDGKDVLYFEESNESRTYLNQMGKPSMLRSILGIFASCITLGDAAVSYGQIIKTKTGTSQDICIASLIFATIFTLGIVYQFASRKFLSEDEKGKLNNLIRSES